MVKINAAFFIFSPQRFQLQQNLRRYIRGEKLLNLVDLERGY